MEDLEKQSGFDLVVTKRDEVTGLVIEENPYTLRVRGEEGGGKSRLWERPKGSGNIFNKKGEPAGRYVSGKYEPEAKHVEFKPPMTDDQKLRQEVIADKAKIAALEKELAAINADKMKAMAGSGAPSTSSAVTNAKKTTGA